MNLKFLVTRTIFETPAISQRALAKRFFVSLGKINHIISEIIDEGLIKKSDKEGVYAVTTEGKKSIESHKVDGALILACGMGVKLAPDENELPICFLKINGERLIERQIEQIKSAGIDDITIMVGFMKEKFDYLIDKYNVKLIYNEEYRYKKTLSTLYHAKELIRNKNMYVCVSDIYMCDNIFHKYEVEPYYTGVYYENCKNEWRYVTNSKNEIKEVVVGGVNDFCLLGISFLTKDFIESFIPLIEEYYEKAFTDDYYWEDVLVRNLSDLPKIYLYKLGKKEIFEFDTIKDINDFDKYNSEFNKEVIEYVAGTFKVSADNIKNVECIKEDIANLLYKFSVDKEEYVIRVPKNDVSEFIDRHNEAEIIEKFKEASTGVGARKTCPYEEVVHFNIDNGYKISKFIKSARPLNIKNEAELRGCMSAYKKLHTSGVKVSGNCDIIHMIENYLDIIKKKEISIPYEDFDIILDKARDIKEIVEREKRPKVICHGDPNPNNILVTNDGYKIIEFEYGGMADPLSDIALFGIYIHSDIEKTYELYKMYEGARVTRPYDVGESDSVGASYASPVVEICADDLKIKKLITCYMALGGLYNALWAIVHGFITGADYGTFGMDSYRTFKNCYAKI